MKSYTLIPVPNSKSQNHAFANSSLKPYKSYVKTVPHMLSGIRKHPLDRDQAMAFVLQTRDGDRLLFDSTNDVLVTYSRDDDEYTRGMCQYLFSRGLLIEYDSSIPYIEYVNGTLFRSDQLPEPIADGIELINGD
jgi:hypothetical protein